MIVSINDHYHEFKQDYKQRGGRRKASPCHTWTLSWRRCRVQCGTREWIEVEENIYKNDFQSLGTFSTLLAPILQSDLP